MIFAQGLGFDEKTGALSGTGKVLYLVLQPTGDISHTGGEDELADGTYLSSDSSIKAESMIFMSREAAESREMELKQEITNISHDLRTPLTSIKGFSELLTDTSISEVKKKEFLAIIQKKIDNLTMIVDLFYELSQIDSSDKNKAQNNQSQNQNKNKKNNNEED